MKKTFILLLALFMCLTGIFADNTGVQVIGGKKVQAETVASTQDNMKLNEEIEVEGVGIVKPTSFEINDSFLSLEHKNPYGRTYSAKSGTEAEYAILRVDITNTNKEAKSFHEECTVTVSFDNDEYIFGGLVYQYKYDWSNGAVLDGRDKFAIEPFYQGHYAFVCTLPNYVVNSKKPLSMTITIFGQAITYVIRK